MLTKTRKTPQNKRAAHAMDAHIGARIRMRRNELGVSQEKLGEALGLSFQQIQKYEKGVNRVSSARLAAIATELQVAVTFFYQRSTDETGAPLPPSTVDDFIATAAGARIAKAFMRIESEGVRATVVTLVEQLAGEAS